MLDKPLVLVGRTAPLRDDTARADCELSDEEPQAPEIVVPDLPSPDAPKADEGKIRHRSAVIAWSSVVPVYPSGTEDESKGSFDVLYELQLVQVDNQAGKRANGMESDWQTLYTGKDLSYDAPLRPGRYYVVRVLAKLVETDAAPKGEAPALKTTTSDGYLFRTLPMAPEDMGAPIQSGGGRNILKLKWSPPNETGGEDDITYTLVMTPAPQGWEGPLTPEGYAQVYQGSEKNLHIKRLQPGFKYTFRIKASNIHGSTRWSPLATFITDASVPATPEPPLQVAQTEDSVTLQWATPWANGSPIQRYVLQMDDGQGGEFSTVYVGMDNEATVGGLHSGLAYRLRLMAENDVGRSMWSIPVSATTSAAVPARPPRPMVGSISRSSANLSWQPPQEDGGSPVILYRVDLQAKTKIAVAEMGSDWMTIYQGATRTCTVSHLCPGCGYRVRVCAINAAGPSPHSIALDFVTAADVPLPPSSPLPTATGPYTMEVGWEPPLHNGGGSITAYNLEVRRLPCSCPKKSPKGCGHVDVDPSDTNFICLYSDLSTQAELSGLPPGSFFEFRVQAVNSQGAGPFSAVAAGSTHPATPSAPAGLCLTANSSSTLQLSWSPADPQGSPVLAYAVNVARVPRATDPACNGNSSNGSVHDQQQQDEEEQQQDSHEQEQHVPNGHMTARSTAGSITSSEHSSIHHRHDRLHFHQVYRGHDTSCEVRNLEPNCSYAVKVRAQNAMGSSRWSDLQYFSTGPAAPSAPVDLRAQGTSSQSITASWHAPVQDNGSPVMYYAMEYAQARNDGKALAWSKCYQGPDNSCTISGLRPGRAYKLRVRAYNVCGGGPFCEPCTSSTLAAPPGSPSRPAFSQKSSSSVRVKWGPPEEYNGASVTAYVLQVAGPEGAYSDAYNGPDTSCKVSTLQPGTSYSFRVAAHNSQGQGPYSEAASVTTALRPPEPPTDITAAPSSTTASITVMWSAPQPAAATAEVASYEVEASLADPHSKGAAPAPVRTTAGKMVQCELSGLLLGGQYAVRMRTIGADGAGHSSWSEPVLVQLPAPPAASTDNDSDAQLAVAGSDGPAAPAEGKAAVRKKGKKVGAAAAAANGDAAQQQQQKQKRKPNSKLVASTSAAKSLVKHPWHQRALRYLLPLSVRRLLRKYSSHLVVLVVFLVFMALLIMPLLDRGKVQPPSLPVPQPHPQPFVELWELLKE